MTGAQSSIKKNYFYNLTYQILAILIPLVTTPYVSRVLGAQGIGDYSYTTGIVSYFGILAATGTVAFGQREIARCQGDPRGRSIIFWSIFWFRLICTLLALFCYIVFISLFLSEYRLLFCINLLTVVSWVLDISWYFQGMEQFRVTAVRNSLVKILGTVLIFVFVRSSNDVWLYTLIFCATNLVGNVSMWTYLRGEIDWVSIRIRDILGILRPIMSLFLPVVAIQIYTVLNKTMLGGLASVKEVGYYTQADKIIQLAITIISSLVTVLLPRISHLYQEHGNSELNGLIQKSIDFINCLSLLFIAVCIGVSDLFVPIFFGPDFLAVIPLLYILCPLFVILSFGQLFGNFLVATNHQRWYTRAVCASAVINFLLNIGLIPSLMSIGVAIATIVAELTATFIQAFCLRRQVDMSYLVKSFIKYALPAAACFLAILICRFIMMDNDSVVSMLVSSLIGVAVYFIVLIIRNDSLIGIVLNKLRLNR